MSLRVHRMLREHQRVLTKDMSEGWTVFPPWRLSQSIQAGFPWKGHLTQTHLSKSSKLSTNHPWINKLGYLGNSWKIHRGFVGWLVSRGSYQSSCLNCHTFWSDAWSAPLQLLFGKDFDHDLIFHSSCWPNFRHGVSSLLSQFRPRQWLERTFDHKRILRCPLTLSLDVKECDGICVTWLKNAKEIQKWTSYKLLIGGDWNGHVCSHIESQRLDVENAALRLWLLNSFGLQDLDQDKTCLWTEPIKQPQWPLWTQRETHAARTKTEEQKSLWDARFFHRLVFRFSRILTFLAKCSQIHAASSALWRDSQERARISGLHGKT